MPASPLRASQARAIARAEAAVARAQRELERAKATRAEVRARYRGRLTLGEPVEAGGFRIKVSEKLSGQSFRLKAFLEKHRLTAAMRPFVGEPTPYDDWQVKALTDEAAEAAQST